MALSNLGRNAEAENEYRAALRFDPNHLGALNNLAWMLAANVDPKLRDGAGRWSWRGGRAT